MTAKRLAEFLMSIKDHEGVLMQQWKDWDGRDRIGIYGRIPYVAWASLDADAELGTPVCLNQIPRAPIFVRGAR